MINTLKLNPHLGLDRQPIFWIAVCFPLILAIGLGIPVWIEYTWEFSKLAYDRFMDISRLPLAVSTLSIPLGILVGRIHGTKQTSLQIEKANLQLVNAKKQLQITYGENKKKNYLEHYGHFKDYIQRIDKEISVDMLYQKLFPSASLSSDSLDVDIKFILSIYGDISRSFGLYKKLREELFNIYNSGFTNLTETQLSDFKEQAFHINLMCMSTLTSVSLNHMWEDLGCLKAEQEIDKELVTVLQFLPVSNASHHSVVGLLIAIFRFADIHHSSCIVKYFETLLKDINDEESELIIFDTERHGRVYGYN